MSLMGNQQLEGLSGAVPKGRVDTSCRYKNAYIVVICVEVNDAVTLVPVKLRSKSGCCLSLLLHLLLSNYIIYHVLLCFFFSPLFFDSSCFVHFI